jgi:predicted Zn finger-like uncharacterized protein
MLIRCQSCQALFSLQDGVAAAGARFKVECGRCLSVFDASAAMRVSERAVTPAPQGPIEVRHTPPAPSAVERQASGDDLAKALRRPAPPVAKRRGRWPWIALGLAVVAAASLVLYARFGGLPRKARERIEKARELLLKDDAKSLEQATALFTEAARLAPGEAAPEGERAFALLLQAAADKDVAARAPRDEAETFARSSTKRLQEGLAAAKAALEDDRDDPAALRAIALHGALTGAPDAASLDKAEQAAPRDPWLAWTRAAVALSGPAARDKQDRALAALAVARQREPRLLRAQVDVAAISIDRQEPGPARDVLSKVLAANPAHERARRLLALLPPAP